jgi:hypothetical protein
LHFNGKINLEWRQLNFAYICFIFKFRLSHKLKKKVDPKFLNFFVIYNHELLLSFFFIFLLLFIFAYKAWLISPPCPPDAYFQGYSYSVLSCLPKMLILSAVNETANVSRRKIIPWLETKLVTLTSHLQNVCVSLLPKMMSQEICQRMEGGRDQGMDG